MMEATINDDRILDACDMQAEITEARDGRTFEDVINEWTDACLRENSKATIEQVVLITRLGTLGQRLIYEANNIGIATIARKVGGR